MIRTILEHGLTYDEYSQRNILEVSSTNIQNLSDADKALFETKKLNIQRTLRIEKTYNVPDKMLEAVKNIDRPQYWMVITENWCGDSAQNIPYIAKFATINPLIDLRIILRDKHPDIMDKYLTNGTRSIPILAAFNESGKEIFRWGPRPETARLLVQKLKAEGLRKQDMYEQLHIWYAKNKGEELEREFVNILENINKPVDF